MTALLSLCLSETGALPTEKPAAGPKLSDQQSRSSPEWIKNAVVYQVNLRSFSERGKFYNLESRLFQLKNMGITCLYLMPVQSIGDVKESEVLKNPYVLKDHRGVNLEFGTKDGFRKLVEEIHLAGLKVIIDWVAGRTAEDHVLVQSNPEWFVKDGEGKLLLETKDGNQTARLDYRSEKLRSYMKKTMTYWVEEFDIDGFRCHRPDEVPLDFWEDARRALVNVKRDIVLVAGGQKPEYHLRAFDLTASPDLYDVMVKMSRQEGNVGLLIEYLEEEADRYPSGSLKFRYSENHEQLRAAKVFGQAHLSFAALIFTLSGIPMIYNGQEIAESSQPSLSEKGWIDWKSGKKNFNHIKKFYKKLMKLRAKHPSFSRGQRFPVRTSDERSVFAFARTYREDAVLVAINFSNQTFEGMMEIPEIFKSKKGKLMLKSVFSRIRLESMKNGEVKLTLPPWGVQIWEAK